MRRTCARSLARVLGAAAAIALAGSSTLAAQARPARAAPPATARRAVLGSRDLAALDQYIARAMRDWRVPGLAIAIVKDDSLVFAKGYGVLEAGKPTPVTPHTRFAIASTTKAMVVASLAMLVDEGKLHWDDRVTDYVPEFRLSDPYASHEFTIRDLLTHRSGLPPTTDLLWYRGRATFPEILHRLRFIEPATSFRSAFEYQNVMYAVAGEVVSRVSGMPWDRFVGTRIFEPLGMRESTTHLSTILGQSEVAMPHALIDDSVRELPPDSAPDPVAPAGSVWSSVSDMSKWMRFVLDSGRIGTTRLIRPETFREIVAPEIRAPFSEYPALSLARPHFFSYALGWFVQDYQGETVWMHTGSIDGMSAIIGLEPAERVGVYVLENLDHAELRHALMYRVFDLSAGRPPRDWSHDVDTLFARLRAADTTASQASGAPPSLPLDAYAGTYADSAFGTIVVTRSGRGLQLRWGREAPRELTPWDHDTFREHEPPSPDPNVSVTFLPDGKGKVSALRIFDVTFVRSEPASTSE